MFPFSKLKYLQQFIKLFLGYRIFAWFFIASISAIILGYIELSVAIGFQLLLQKLNILTDKIELPVFFHGWTPSLIWVLVYFTTIIFLKAVLQGIVTMSGTIAYVGIGAKLRISAYYSLLQRKNPKFISAAEINFRITEISLKAGNFCNFGFLLLTQGIQSLTLMFIMLWLAWEISLFSIGLLGIVGVMLFVINRAIHPIAQQLPAEVLAINKRIQLVVRNWLLVYILRTNNREYEHLVNREIRYHSLNLRIVFLNFLNNAIPATFGMFLLLGVIFANIKYFKIEASIFLSFIYIFFRFVQSLASASNMFGRTIENYPQLKIAFSEFFQLSTNEIESCVVPIQLISLFNLKPSYKNNPINYSQSMKTISSPPTIEFSDVNFSYSSSTEPVLKKVSLRIESGQQIGIIGRSGSGKSTILGLMLGILQSTSGKVLLNAQSSNDFFENYRIKTGYVGAEPFLIEGTIKDNLNYGHSYEGEITSKQYDKALQFSNLYEMIESLPGKMEYKISENGDGLSAGQKQRLSLARAILILPRLLILDEVSANLDTETELDIAKSIKYLKGKSTVVIVSHKQGILQFADSVIDLDQINH